MGAGPVAALVAVLAIAACTNAPGGQQNIGAGSLGTQIDCVQLLKGYGVPVPQLPSGETASPQDESTMWVRDAKLFNPDLISYINDETAFSKNLGDRMVSAEAAAEKVASVAVQHPQLGTGWAITKMARSISNDIKASAFASNTALSNPKLITCGSLSSE